MPQIVVQLKDERKVAALVELLNDLNFVESVTTSESEIETVPSRDGGTRAIVRGTNVGVDVIVGYSQAGYTPREIASEILPHLTLAQVYDALYYYKQNQEALDEIMGGDQADAWRARLRSEMGAEAAAKLLGDK